MNARPLPLLALALALGAALLATAVWMHARGDREEGTQRAQVGAPSPMPETPATPAPVAIPAAAVPARSTAEPGAPLAVTPAPSPPRAQPEDRVEATEGDVLAELHDLAASDPEQSLRLARAALERFPRSAGAPELAWNVVKALVNMGRRDDATTEARAMVRSYPDSAFTSDVERHLLYPQPNQ